MRHCMRSARSPAPSGRTRRSPAASAATPSSRSTSATDSVLGSGRACFGPSTMAVGFLRRVALEVEELVELPHGREPPRGGRGLQAALGEGGEEAAHRLRARLVRGRPDLAAEIAIVLQIPAVGRERVLRRPALGGEHVEEQRDQAVVACRPRAPGRRLAHRGASREGGTVVVISRGCGSTKVASAHMPA